mmetsp:Transcript_143277/g.399422  ORF Transcript_143277/g.399422 Transcript_143277/m.399422 type:complete len:285 (+) Transcript_143277:110-964(+)
METSSSRIRSHAGDTERIRLLKEVLRSSARVTAGPRQAPWWEQPSGQPARRVSSPWRQRWPQQPVAAPDLLDLVDECELADGALGEALASSQLLPLLWENSRRLRGLTLRADKAARAASSGAGGSRVPSDGADVTAHGAASATRVAAPAKAFRVELDRAASRAVERCARFPHIDALATAVEGSTSVEELRAAEIAPGCPAFPRRHRHHLGLTQLTDQVLLADRAACSAMLRRAAAAGSEPTVEAANGAPGGGGGGGAPLPRGPQPVESRTRVMMLRGRSSPVLS